MRESAPMLSVQQVADRLGVKKLNAVRILIRSGKLRGSNVSAGARPTYRVDPADLDAFIRERQVAPPPPATRRRKPSPMKVHRYF